MHTFKQRCFTPKLFCFLLVAALLCFARSAVAHAEVEIERPKQTYYLIEEGDSSYLHNQKKIVFYVETTGRDRIDESSIQSDNEAFSGPVSCYKPLNDPNAFYLGINIPDRPGKADISFGDQSGKTYTVTAEVLPYENPLESLKITNINNGKNLAEAFRQSYKNSSAPNVFSKKTAAPKIKVKAKKGWRLISMSVYAWKYKKGYYNSVYQGEFENINARSKTVKLSEMDKGVGMAIKMEFINTKNGAHQYVSYSYG